MKGKEKRKENGEKKGHEKEDVKSHFKGNPNRKLAIEVVGSGSSSSGSISSTISGSSEGLVCRKQDSSLKGLGQKELDDVYTEIAYGCLDVSQVSVESLIHAIADGDMSKVRLSPTAEDVERRGVLCLSYIRLSPGERYGKAGMGTMASRYTLESLQRAVMNIRKVRDSSAELPYLWFDQAYQLRKNVETKTDGSTRTRGEDHLGLIAYMLYPVLYLEEPRGTKFDIFRTRLWP